MRTRNTGVVNSSPPRVTIKVIGEEGNGKPPRKISSLEKLRALSMVTLEIEYAMRLQ